NTLRWDGKPGHYEVYYLSATDPDSGVGMWIRYTMLAPLDTSEQPSCAVWLLVMDPPGVAGGVFARKQTFTISQLKASREPFSLQIAENTLDDHGMRGSFQDVSFDLRWQPRLGAYEHVHPFLRRARIAKTVLCLPHADLQVSGTIALPGRELRLERARGGQAHLWGSKHATRWAWLHCNDLRDPDGNPLTDSFIDAVSVLVPRYGRQVGPSTPVLARIGGDDFRSISPLRVLTNRSRFGLSRWELQASDGRRRLRIAVDAPRDRLAGVTYQDPDRELAYCYNTEVASLRVGLWERTGRGDWALERELTAPGLAHFEYAQREPLAGVDLALN
ncbi:MAG TPA: hypothetical protein VGF15_06755, partial [Solirubrobacteraceae bacterium]